MRISVSTAVSCAREAVQDFSLREYVPFGILLAAQALFLILALNLGAPWGMATAGWLAMRVGGEGVTHYPGFFVFLPNLMSVVEAFLYTIPGSVLIPLSIARILQPMDPALRAPGATAARVKRAVLPVLAAALAGAALLAAWQTLLPMGPGPFIRSLAGGGPSGESAYWLAGILVAYVISACFLCVPVVAVKEGGGFGGTLVKGVKSSVQLVFFTYAFAILFSSLALFVLYITQVFGGQLVRQLRPEVMALLLGVYIVLINIGSYFLYAATTRLFIAARPEAS
ncbi:MAG TPA: hypothetical protein VJW75_05410 [Candidatus Eisenbacteria bacterium]|nr:hypothetical protein [Candidatus Eisenbacteria bacterium]